MKADRFRSWWWAFAIAALYFAVTMTGALHHELWLDEAHHWLLGKYSTSPADLLHNARYEGHPPLWNLLLYFLARVTDNAVSMQVLNVVIASIAVLLFVRYAPFQFFFRATIPFSYFILYEYGVISRNYAIVFLLLIIVAVLYPKRHSHFLLFSFALFLLASAHLFAAVIAVSVFSLVIWERFRDRGVIPAKKFWPGVFLFTGLLVLLILLVVPPADHFLYQYDTDALFSAKRIGKTVSVAWKGFFPFPDTRQTYLWNSNLLISLSKKAAILPVLLAWLVPFVLIRKRVPLFIFWFSGGLILAFMFKSPLIVASRHCGFLFLLLLFSMWIDAFYPDRKNELKAARLKLYLLMSKPAKPLFAVMIVVQLLATIFLFAEDYRRPFSQGKNVGDYLLYFGWKKEQVVISPHFAGPAICAYYGKPLFYAENNADESFCRWNTKPFMLSNDSVFKRCRELMDRTGKDSLLLILDQPLPSSKGYAPVVYASGLRIDPVNYFTGSLVKAEDYYLYELKKFVPVIP